jgi:hypothetical protein
MFPYENIVAGVAILIVGFVFHFLGQLVSVINWDRATRLGLQEKHMLPEYRVYEHAIAVADVMLGWVYGIAGVGLILGATWGYKLAAIPGAILVYHGISAWFWERNRRTAGHLESAIMRARHPLRPGGPHRTQQRLLWTQANR